MVAATKNHQVDVTAFITHHVGFNEVKQEFESWLNPQKEVIRAMVSMN